MYEERGRQKPQETAEGRRKEVAERRDHKRTEYYHHSFTLIKTSTPTAHTTHVSLRFLTQTLHALGFLSITLYLRVGVCFLRLSRCGIRYSKVSI